MMWKMIERGSEEGRGGMRKEMKYTNTVFLYTYLGCNWEISGRHPANEIFFYTINFDLIDRFKTLCMDFNGAKETNKTRVTAVTPMIK